MTTRKIAGTSGNWTTPIILIVVVIAAALLGTAGPGSIDRIALAALINILLCVGLYIFVGNTGIMSFGHVAFVGVGAYVGGLATIPADQRETLLPNAPEFIKGFQLDTIPSIVVAGVIAALLAAITGAVLMRLSDLAAGLASLSLLLIVNRVAAAWEPVTRGSKGLPAIPVTTTHMSVVIWIAVAVLIAFVFQKTRAAQRLRASRDEEVAARALGVRVPWERGVSWVLSAFVSGIGGALYAQSMSSISPKFFYIDLTFVIVAMLVVGGTASLSGAIIGGVSISIIGEVLRQAEGGNLFWLFSIPESNGLKNIGLALITLLILIFRRDGLTKGRELVLRRRRKATVAEAAGD